jgi:hypothetical protein
MSDRLVHVRCHCGWDGLGDPTDPCYGCGELESLSEIDPEDERCIHCGERGCTGECEEAL